MDTFITCNFCECWSISLSLVTVLQRASRKAQTNCSDDNVVTDSKTKAAEAEF